MAVQHLSDPTQLNGVTVNGSDGEKIGKVAEVYLDDKTSKPEWVAVKTGMFGGHVSLVPLAHAELDGGTLRVPYGKDQVKDAPHQDPDRELSSEQEAQIFEHYGVSYGGETVTAQTGDQGHQASGQRASGQQSRQQSGQQSGQRAGSREDLDGQLGGPGEDVSGRNTDQAMTRSEEQMHVGTRSEEVGRARLRKYVVTEQQTQTVPVSHEEVRIEREPITDDNRGAATDGPAISEEEHEVVLQAERPVVEKEAVPVERVKLGTETVHGEETVSEEVRKEQVETHDGPGTPKSDR